jgi:glycosyltransferase involved in cell wall biosynthesis
VTIRAKTIVLAANRGFALWSSRRDLIERLTGAGYVIVLVTRDDEYARRLLGDRVCLEPIRFSRGGVSPSTDIHAYFRMRRLYRKHQPVLVHHFHAKPVILGSLAARHTVPHARIVNTITGLGHAFQAKGVARSLAGMGYRLALPKSDRVIFQNPDDLRLFVDAGWVASERARLIPGSGVNTALYQPISARPAAREAPVVLMIARLLWSKGVGEYIEMAERLRAEGLAARIQLAGEIDHEHPDAVPESVIEDARHSGTIEYLGYLSDVRSALQQADVFVLPSYYAEGLPRVVLEAASCGLPSIVADAPGTREAVRAGLTGLLVPPRDADALTDAVRGLIADPDRRKTMGDAARQLAIDEYDIEKVISEQLAVYRELGIDAGDERDHSDLGNEDQDARAALSTKP